MHLSGWLYGCNVLFWPNFPLLRSGPVNNGFHKRLRLWWHSCLCLASPLGRENGVGCYVVHYGTGNSVLSDAILLGAGSDVSGFRVCRLSDGPRNLTRWAFQYAAEVDANEEALAGRPRCSLPWIQSAYFGPFNRQCGGLCRRSRWSFEREAGQIKCWGKVEANHVSRVRLDIEVR